MGKRKRLVAEKRKEENKSSFFAKLNKFIKKKINATPSILNRPKVEFIKKKEIIIIKKLIIVGIVK